MGKGTHQGPLQTPNEQIPPTNRRLEMRFVEAWDFVNGKITAGRMYFDSASFMSQLGLGAATTAQAQRPSAPGPRH